MTLVYSRRGFMRLAASLPLLSSTPPVFAQTTAQRSLPRYAGPWKSLFNGENLEGWSFYQEGVGTADKHQAAFVSDGEIQILGEHYKGDDQPGFGHIATLESYSNYHLRFDFRYGDKRFEPRLLAKRNSGLLYHMQNQAMRVWPNSTEFQLEESDMGDAILINARCWPGSDVGGTPAWPKQIPIDPKPVFPPPRDPRPLLERQRVKKNGDFENRGEWNRIELLAIGDKAAHLVNGRIVASLFDLTVQDPKDRDNYLSLNSGRIGLEIEAAEAYFKNVEIRFFESA